MTTETEIRFDRDYYEAHALNAQRDAARWSAEAMAATEWWKGETAFCQRVAAAFAYDARHNFDCFSSLDWTVKNCF